MIDLTGKVAIVTGASSGIGRAIAEALASHGAKVAIVARRIDRLEQLAKERPNHTYLPLKTDVTQETEIKKAVSQTMSTFGRLDILINNAGIYRNTPVPGLDISVWDETIITNLKAYALFGNHASQEMIKQNRGRIINIGSIAMGGIGMGFPGGAAYTASKGGVAGLTASLALDLAPHKILVNCIAPGLIESEMTQGILNDKSVMETYLPRIPLKRPGKPEEIAALATFLASDEASYITGATIVCDGGWTIS